MTVSEVDELFKVDDFGQFVNLVLPKDKWGEEVDLRGTKRLDMDFDLIVRVKKYADKLYSEALRKN